MSPGGTSIQALLAPLRAQRRQTVETLRHLRKEQLTVHVGPERPTDVRAALLSLAMDDDRRAATLGQIMVIVNWHSTEAHTIVAAMARTRGELRGLLVPVDDETVDQLPAPDEWAVRQALLHLMNNEERLVEDIGYAVMRLHSRQPFVAHHPGASRAAGTVGPDVAGGRDALRDRLERVRDSLVASATSLTAEELSAPTLWAGQQVDLRHMLLRRASHERQHMVQIAKTLRAIGCHPGEAEMLLAEAEIARGALEGMFLGIPAGLTARDPGNDLPTIEQLLHDATAEEAAHVQAIQRATA
jgi:hypothetical protein